MKKLLMMIYASVFALSLMAGCSALMPNTTKQLAVFVDNYCLMSDELQREAIRNDFNAQTKIGDVEITCE